MKKIEKMSFPRYGYASAICVMFLFPLFSFVSLRFLMVNPGSDLHDHLLYAQNFGEVGIASPHFLYQAVVYAMLWLPGLGLHLTGSLVIGVAYAVMGLTLARLIFLFLLKRSPFIAVFLCVAPLISTHIFLPTMFGPNFYYNYLVPLTYHNPTQHLNKMFALVIWFIFVSLVFLGEKDIAKKWPQLVVLSMLCVLSALAKPSFLIAFLPLCGALGVKAVIERRWISFSAFTLALVPVVLVLFWQRGMHFTEGNLDNVSIAFLPFAVLQDYTQIILCLPLSLAFPIAVTLLGIGGPEDRRALRWAWFYTAIALFFVFFMAEVPEAWTGDGNFFWTGQTAVFLMICQSAVILARNWNGLRGKSLAAFVVLGVHFAFGLIFAGAAAFFPATGWL